MRAIVLALAFATALAAPAAHADTPDDPLKSPMWRDLAKRYFDGAEVKFDDRVKVVVPDIIEDQAQVPVTADARPLDGDGVEKLIVFADLNPIQHVLTLTPQKAASYVSFRMKVEQATPIRAAALTRDGVWHVGGVYLEAAGGGCTAPAMARKDANWSDTVGQAQGRLWRDLDGMTRMRLRIRHPMDTGLAKDNTPAYYIEKFEMRTDAGEGLAMLEAFEPLSEDPTLTLLLKLPPNESALDVDARDNNGGIYRSRLTAPWRQSGLEQRPAQKAAAKC